MDIKEKIEEVVKKVQSNPDLLAQFKKEPIKAVESILGIDLPDEVIQKVVDGVKAKISLDKASGIVDTIKKLF